MSEFVQELQRISQEKIETLQEERREWDKQNDDASKAKILELKTKYEPDIIAALEKKANIGKRECHMNFVREDFERTGINKPSVVASIMLREMCAPGEKLNGITFDVWNNAAFTVHFKW